jgi:hypothetical protein
MQTEFKNFFTTPRVKWSLAALAAVLVLLLTFDAGVSVGERHAYDRASRFGQAMPPPPPDAGVLPHGFMPEEHGAVGTITQVALPLITLKTRSGETESIRVSTSTLVRQGSQTISTEGLSVGENVIIIGEPSQPNEPGAGEQSEQIDARLIRVLP